MIDRTQWNFGRWLHEVVLLTLAMFLLMFWHDVAAAGDLPPGLPPNLHELHGVELPKDLPSTVPMPPKGITTCQTEGNYCVSRFDDFLVLNDRLLWANKAVADLHAELARIRKQKNCAVLEVQPPQRGGRS